MLFQCWFTVYDAGPTLKQHCNTGFLVYTWRTLLDYSPFSSDALIALRNYRASVSPQQTQDSDLVLL